MESNHAFNLVESKFGLADADVWEVIQEASKLDHELAQDTLDAAGLTLPKGSMTVVVDKKGN